ncbi:hypothetical protein AKJ09_06996 [Labilithrix luteola]|uniref:Knr4/Smi1-like domain-containing protein n=1 Tax=Labilithrix luteola TaxID=1391654 RepID=A0A0K1Q3L2_9BACT|nr:SMI1/KNR4 family protein [Labilithrix luteola]AKV00333.1 hypothetical protein AKJ09_06996 [Labilithrix luteola]
MAAKKLDGDVDWKPVKSLSYRSAQQRTKRDAIGTAYWAETPKKHYLYVKTKEDGWLCFGGRSVEACLDEFRKKPGKGGPANDHLIANGISISPKDKLQTILKTAVLNAGKTAKKKTSVKQPTRLTRKLSPNEMWNVLEARGADVVRRPVTMRDIKAAEKALGCRFPASYVELVTRHGAPAIGPKAKHAESLSFAVLVPSEVARFTRGMRDVSADMFEEPDSFARVKAMLANAVLFQLSRETSDGYVFLLDTADAKGEMAVAYFMHDDLEELKWKRSSPLFYPSLCASSLDVARTIEKQWMLD